MKPSKVIRSIGNLSQGVGEKLIWAFGWIERIDSAEINDCELMVYEVRKDRIKDFNKALVDAIEKIDEHK